MADEFAEIRTEAIATIKQYGRKCRLIVVTEATPVDVNKPWNVGPGTATYYPAATGGMFAVSDVPMDKTDDGEPAKNCIIPGDVGYPPNRALQVEIMDGEDAGIYSIAALNTYAPNGVAIGWKVRLKSWPTS